MQQNVWVLYQILTFKAMTTCLPNNQWENGRLCTNFVGKHKQIITLHGNNHLKVPPGLVSLEALNGPFEEKKAQVWSY